MGNGFSAISVVDGRLYTLWEVDIKETFGAPQATYGFASSALVEGDVVVLDIGAEDGKGYAGLNRESGEVLWTGGPFARGPGYSSPLLVEIAGERQVVILAVTSRSCCSASGRSGSASRAS